MSNKKQHKRNLRSTARLYAVQALYQIETTDEPSSLVVKEFRDLRLKGGDVDGEIYHPADEELFIAIVSGVAKYGDEINEALDRAMTGRQVETIERLIRCVLRAAAYEMAKSDGTPAKVIVNEYIDLAKAYFGGGEPKFVNGTLDRLAREVRSDEMAQLDEQRQAKS